MRVFLRSCAHWCKDCDNFEGAHLFLQLWVPGSHDICTPCRFTERDTLFPDLVAVAGKESGMMYYSASHLSKSATVSCRWFWFCWSFSFGKVAGHHVACKLVLSFKACWGVQVSSSCMPAWTRPRTGPCSWTFAKQAKFHPLKELCGHRRASP